jgi:hypothetical protein
MSDHRYFYNVAYKCTSEKFNRSDIVYARDTNEAAEIFAKDLYRFYDEKFSTIDVVVREASNHYAKTYRYEVKVDLQPSFSAIKTGEMD